MSENAGFASPDRRAEIGGLIDLYNEQLVGMREARRALLLTYRNALETMNEDFATSEQAATITLLREELTAGRRGSVLALLDRFVEDLAVYGTRPDLSEAEVLALALSD
jgi:hypothetical protein